MCGPLGARQCVRRFEGKRPAQGADHLKVSGQSIANWKDCGWLTLEPADGALHSAQVLKPIAEATRVGSESKNIVKCHYCNLMQSDELF